MQISPGLYRHYKGGEYFVYRIATHSETGEALVVYRCLYGDFGWWVRPLTMFTETIERGGEQLARFEFVAPMSLNEADDRASGRAAQPAAEADTHWMARARELAERAWAEGEVPVGAVLVRGAEAIGEGYNRPITGCDPTAHAEIQALRDAAAREHNYRLTDSTLYVTLEPCTMCVGAIVHARVGRLVFGAYEPKAGAVESQTRLFEAAYFNHTVGWSGGVDRELCQRQLRAFFRQRREAKKRAY